MTLPTPLQMMGAPGSPYTRKLRAVMRYRRIPHHFVIRNSKSDHDYPAPPVGLMPVLVLPGEGGAEPAVGRAHSTLKCGFQATSHRNPSGSAKYPE